MAETQTQVDSAGSTSASFQERLARLSHALHLAYCMAVCLDRALRYNVSDDSPELAVCVNEYLVRPLDALSIETKQLHDAFDAQRAAAERPA